MFPEISHYVLDQYFAYQIRCLIKIYGAEQIADIIQTSVPSVADGWAKGKKCPMIKIRKYFIALIKKEGIPI
jgi:hypothetical protein